jgi:hypothetical protein
VFLQIIYSIPNPSINNVETLASLVHLADKYDAKGAFDIHNDYLPLTLSNSPLQAYAILCEEGAEAVARRAPFASPTCPNSSPP